jgi:hypothetical protein
MSHLNQRRTLQTVACAHALQAGCPRAPLAHAGQPNNRSHWLRVTCALACRCTARFRALLVLLGVAGITGFCAAGVGFFTGWLSESQYLAWVAGSLGVFAASVAIAHLGDPYELKRNECRRAFVPQPPPVEPVAVAVARATSHTGARSASSAALN